MVYKCSIIANPEGRAWDFACRIHEELDKKEEDFSEINKLIIKRFNDGESKPKIEKNVRGKNCFFIHDSNENPAYWFLHLCLVNNALKNSSAHEVINVIPYMKFARQDRKDESRVPISTQVIAESIEHDHTRVLTMEVHNPAIQGSFRVPFDSLYSFPTVIDYLQKNYLEILENIVIATPDEGGVKRARAFANRLGNPNISIGSKFRETDGKVERLEFSGDVSGKRVLVIDDIVDSGVTLINASRVLREEMKAAEVYAYATHGLFTKGYEQLSKSFEKIFIGNTVKQPYVVPDNLGREDKEKYISEFKLPENIEYISFVSLFAEAIHRISRGQSLSALFN